MRKGRGIRAASPRGAPGDDRPGGHPEERGGALTGQQGVKRTGGAPATLTLRGLAGTNTARCRVRPPTPRTGGGGLQLGLNAGTQLTPGRPGTAARASSPRHWTLLSLLRLPQKKIGGWVPAQHRVRVQEPGGGVSLSRAFTRVNRKSRMFWKWILILPMPPNSFKS